MLLTRRPSSPATPAAPTGASSLVTALSRGLSRSIPTLDRRSFLRRSGLGVGAGMAASQLTLVKPVAAAEGAKATLTGTGKVEVRRTVCGHCSVGCAVDAVVENGVWVRQEPVFDSPINLGAHCAKGAALREHGHGEYRLKYPMKLVDGKYKRISWDEALNEISAKLLEIRKQSGPDALFVVGSSKHNNEQAYLLRKWVSFWGSNNTDHQARICHSTTVAGVANLGLAVAADTAALNISNDVTFTFSVTNAGPAAALDVSLTNDLPAGFVLLSPRLTYRCLKSTPPSSRPMTGITTSLTSESTILPKAVPMITPTARSTTLPFMANSLNSLRMLMGFSL